MPASSVDIQSEIRLRPLREEDVTGEYLSWFRDHRVIRYLEVRNPTKQECIEYIQNQFLGNYYLYAICLQSSGIHIGNVKIGPIVDKHGLSDLVTIIGNSCYWGKGYATEAIQQALSFAFAMGIRKISAGIYSDNKASLLAYTKAGFQVEAVLKDHYLLDGKMQDRICVSIFNPAYNIH